MNARTDQQLLRDYAGSYSEPAFAELVRRHIDLVYSAALRMVCDSHLAEDVTQGVFVALAQNARQLTHHPVLSGWLHRTTQNLAANAVRTNVRRQTREQEAVAMNELLSAGSDVSWEHIAPHLDAALGELSEPDRDAVLLRYFERKSAQEMAERLGISTEAAQKRVSRAVERLREFFAKRGVTVGASGFVAVISANAVQAAPAGLAVTVSTAAVLAALSLSASAGAGATTGFFGLLSHVTRSKFVAGFAAAVLFGVATFLAFRSLNQANPGTASNALQTAAANPPLNLQTAGMATQDANAADDQREPDPLQLLLKVAQARQRIASGSMEFQISVAQIERSTTNQLRLVALFDGPKLRSEQFGREYSYKYLADEAEAQEITKRADSMDRESAVQAGLLEAFESHHTTAYDGVSLLDYWETGRKHARMTIDDPNKGTTQFIFDPRCLGLRTSVSVSSTVENCLGYNEAKSIALVGEEFVEGVPAWHVRVQSKHDETLDFWMEMAHPERLLKHARGSDVAVSRYAGPDSRDPIPTEVTTMDFRNGSPSFGKRFIRSKSEYNLPVDPSAFTLAGLGMAVGTSVVDVRIHRSIGYWTGTGLSEDLPRKQGRQSQSPPPPKLEEQLALLKYYPTGPEALEAGTWIILNTPDGSEVEQAAEVILREHTHDTNLVHLCRELERVRPRRSKDLLEAILKNNPSTAVQGAACFTLAKLLKDEAKFGQNKQATAQAVKQFERVIAEFGQLTERGYPLEELAKPELFELRHLSIGKPAPEIEGEDLAGQPMKLSAQRGKVVVIVFWWLDYNDAPKHRKLAERMAGRPFAMLGVYGENDLTKGKAEVEKYGITWPSFWDKRDGPISKNWNVRGWPDVWVLDQQGVIRYREVRGADLDEAVDALLWE